MKTGAATCKRPKTVQCWDRDIICLPQAFATKIPIPFPRGKSRDNLSKLDLFGKIRLLSSMSVEEVQEEVRSVFSKAMGGRKDFPFVFLEPTGAGCRSLTTPSTSSSFSWTAQQVAKLGSTKKSIYILAKDKLFQEFEEYDFDIETDDDDSETRASFILDKDIHDSAKDRGGSAAGLEEHIKNSTAGPSTSMKLIPTPDTESYQTYADLIDLTLPSDSEESELDELPPVAINLHDDLITTRTELEIPDPIAAKHAVLKHQQLVIGGEHDKDVQRVHVRRSHLLQDAFRAFKKPNFNCSKMLKVTFIGEESVDDGGPRREFFQILMRDCFSKSGLFVGWPSNTVPAHNVEAVANNNYYIVGKMLSTCIIQGGQPPVCLSRGIADYLVYDEIRSKPCLEDISDYAVRQKLLKVQNAHSTSNLQQLLEEMEFRFECGYTKPTRDVNIGDKLRIMTAIWLHYIFFLPLAELQQFRKGFRETLQMELLIIRYPEYVYSFLVSSPQFEVTVPYFLDSFAISYSPQGSNKRTKEEAIILNWNEYVTECNGNPISIADILNFMSGSSKLPATGFDKTPSLHSTDDCCLPKASTCDLSITFSRSFGLLSFEEFKDKMDMAISNSFGFGIP